MNKDSTRGGPAFLDIADGVINGILSAPVLISGKIVGMTEQMAKFIADTAISTTLRSKMSQQISELATKQTFEELEAILPAGMYAKVSAELLTKNVVDITVKNVVDEATVIVGKSMFGPVGAFVQVLQLWGMVLDAMDTRGINNQMGQSMLDATRKQYDTAYNSSEDFIKAGIIFPREFSPVNTVAFKAQFIGDDIQKQMYTDIVDYLGRLTTNSDGLRIVPAFTSKAELDRIQLKQQYSVYWKMANQNDIVFDQLVKYGWVMWLLVAIIGAVIIIVPLAMVLPKKKTGSLNTL
jgi:hypothetical protein